METLNNFLHPWTEHKLLCSCNVVAAVVGERVYCTAVGPVEPDTVVVVVVGIGAAVFAVAVCGGWGEYYQMFALCAAAGAQATAEWYQSFLLSVLQHICCVGLFAQGFASFGRASCK